MVGTMCLDLPRPANQRRLHVVQGVSSSRAKPRSLKRQSTTSTSNRPPIVRAAVPKSTYCMHHKSDLDAPQPHVPREVTDSVTTGGDTLPVRRSDPFTTAILHRTMGGLQDLLCLKELNTRWKQSQRSRKLHTLTNRDLSTPSLAVYKREDAALLVGRAGSQ